MGLSEIMNSLLTTVILEIYHFSYRCNTIKTETSFDQSHAIRKI